MSFGAEFWVGMLIGLLLGFTVFASCASDYYSKKSRFWRDAVDKACTVKDCPCYMHESAAVARRIEKSME